MQVLGASFQGTYSARIFTGEAVREIQQHAKESPDSGFYLYLAMQSVHGNNLLSILTNLTFRTLPEAESMHLACRPMGVTRRVRRSLQ